MLFGPCSRDWTPALFSAVHRLKVNVSFHCCPAPQRAPHQGSRQPGRLTLWLCQVLSAVHGAPQVTLASLTGIHRARSTTVTCRLPFGIQFTRYVTTRAPFSLDLCFNFAGASHHAPIVRPAGSALQDRVSARPRAAHAGQGRAGLCHPAGHRQGTHGSVSGLGRGKFPYSSTPWAVPSARCPCPGPLPARGSAAGCPTVPPLPGPLGTFRRASRRSRCCGECPACRGPELWPRSAEPRRTQRRQQRRAMAATASPGPGKGRASPGPQPARAARQPLPALSRPGPPPAPLAPAASHGSARVTAGFL